MNCKVGKQYYVIDFNNGDKFQVETTSYDDSMKLWWPPAEGLTEEEFKQVKYPFLLHHGVQK